VRGLTAVGRLAPCHTEASPARYELRAPWLNETRLQRGEAPVAGSRWTPCRTTMPGILPCAVQRSPAVHAGTPAERESTRASLGTQSIEVCALLHPSHDVQPEVPSQPQLGDRSLLRHQFKNAVYSEVRHLQPIQAIEQGLTQNKATEGAHRCSPQLPYIPRAAGAGSAGYCPAHAEPGATWPWLPIAC